MKSPLPPTHAHAHGAHLLGASLLACAFVCSCSGGKSTGTGGYGATTSSSGTGGTGGADDGAPPSWNRMVTPPADATAAAARLACTYKAGSLPAETQGASHPSGDKIPVKHILILMQENRSFDHYFTKLPQNGQTDVEVAPASYTNPDMTGTAIAPFHDSRYCLVDTNHEWKGSHEEYNNGMMDRFVLANEGSGTPPPHPLSDSMSGVRAMAYYDNTDIPFYYWLANEFSIADHYHSSLLGPTWPNRMYLYGSSSRGATRNTLTSFYEQKGPCNSDADCGGAAGSCVGGGCKGACTVDEDCGKDAPVGSCDAMKGGACKQVGRTIFDYMEQRKINWKVYASGTAGFKVMGDTWAAFTQKHEKKIADYYTDAAADTLPEVAFIDPHIGAEAYDQDDEHPPAAPHGGQSFVAKVIDALVKSPAWTSSALFFTYDEHGGLFDHVPPPPACAPGDKDPVLSPGDPTAGFDRYGVRVPMMLISPFAKKHFVAHHVYDHTSIARFIQARFVLPAITDRDANAEVPWEMFDFDNPPHLTPPTVTMPAPLDPAKLAACAQVWVP